MVNLLSHENFIFIGICVLHIKYMYRANEAGVVGADDMIHFYGIIDILYDRADERFFQGASVSLRIPGGSIPCGGGYDLIMFDLGVFYFYPVTQ